MNKFSSKTQFVLCLLACIILNILVFYPSFFHTARGTDHLNYLYETSAIENLGESIASSYSYGRTRTLIEGDTFLFRPLFYLLFVFLKFFFRYDFFFWQIAGFILHFIVQYQFYRIFRIKASVPISFLFTLSFAFLLLPQEAVIRHHLNGYLIFIIFYLEAIYQYCCFLKNDAHQRKHMMILLLSLFASCFAFEFGVFLIFFLILFHQLMALRPLNTQRTPSIPLGKFLCLPMIGYLLINATDFLYHKSSFTDKSFFVSINFKGQLNDFFILLSNIKNVVVLWFKGHLLPSFATFQLDAWDTFTGLNFSSLKELQIINIVFLVALFLFTGLCLLKIKSKTLLSATSSKKYLMLGLFHLFITLFYISLYSLTRLSDRPDYIYNALHHYYLIDTFLILGVFFCVYPYVHKLISNNKNIYLCFVTLLSLFILINGTTSFDFFYKRAALDNPLRKYILSLDQFIHEHKEESDFSFRTEKTTVDNFYVDSRGPGPSRVRFMADFLFENYYRQRNPKYHLVFSQKYGLKVFRQRKNAVDYTEKIEDEYIILNRNLIPYGSHIDIQVTDE